MRKIAILAAVASALCSCIHDKFVDRPTELSFVVSADPRFTLAEDPAPPPPLSTRAPIHSTEAVQSIADVRVHAFRTTDNGVSYLYVRSFDISASWPRNATSTSHNVPRVDMLENGSYRFLAVGMDTATDYTIALTPGVAYNTVAARLATSPQSAQELFSGRADRVIGGGVNTVPVTLTRRVAGVMLYVRNVPTTINGTPTAFLRLSLARSNLRVDITSDPAESADPPAVSEPGYNIFDIDLRPQSDTNPADGLWDGSTPPDGVQKLPATTLAGAYILPGLYTDGPTMRLSLVGADGTTLLRSWSVLDISNQPIFFTWPNYFYSLGRKLQAATTDNGTPADPADDDAPLDLSRAQAMNVDVSEPWGNVYPMSLRDN